MGITPAVFREISPRCPRKKQLLEQSKMKSLRSRKSREFSWWMNRSVIRESSLSFWSARSTTSSPFPMYSSTSIPSQVDILERNSFDEATSEALTKTFMKFVESIHKQSLPGTNIHQNISRTKEQQGRILPPLSQLFSLEKSQGQLKRKQREPDVPSAPRMSIEEQPRSFPLDGSESARNFLCKWGNCTSSFTTRTGLATHCVEHLAPLLQQGPKKRKVVVTCNWDGCGEICSGVRFLLKHLAMPSHIGQTPFLPRDLQPSCDDPLRPVKLYPCSAPGCGKRFTDSSNRKKHEKTHDVNRERFYCPESGCKKSYSTKTDLNIHLKVHKQDFPHKCSHPNCTKAFVRVSELYAHERSHDNILPHTCSICGKRFREKIRLRKHQESHPIQTNPHPGL